MDWANLLMCVGMIYGTRIYAIREKRKTVRAAAPRHPSGGVSIPGVGIFAGDDTVGLQ
jgi:hypothetical protein